MALINAGYWPSTYWPDGFWHQKYWPHFGVAVISYEILLQQVAVMRNLNDGAAVIRTVCNKAPVTGRIKDKMETT